MVVLARLSVADVAYQLRRAAPTDVPAIVRLLAADPLGATRDGGASHTGPGRSGPGRGRSADGGTGDGGTGDGGARGGGAPDLTPYREAFAAIDADPAHLLVVLAPEIAASEPAGPGIAGPGEVVGTMQLSFIPGLARRGSLRAQVEAVRIRADHRGAGLGGAMMAWAISEARRRGCSLVQLTSDKRRSQAHRFYARLGFVASHEGLKLIL